MDDTHETPDAKVLPEGPSERPAYEPPRIVKKRSVSRVTLFTGGGPSEGGLVGADLRPFSPFRSE
jgi:hypothetical protein